MRYREFRLRAPYVFWPTKRTLIAIGLRLVAQMAMTKQNPGDMREAQRHIRGLREQL